MQWKFAVVLAVAVGAGIVGAAAAQKSKGQKETTQRGREEAAIAAAWPGATGAAKQSLTQDETQRACSGKDRFPPSAVAREIQARETSRIVRPADGRYLGDWRRGEAIAQSGYGLRFTDTDAGRPNGGNCYACHQIDQAEVSYGTIGPSLAGYGRSRRFSDVAARFAYEKIYDAHATLPCSAMPRFGANGVLTVNDIKDLVALLMDPDSPVNK